MASSEMQNEFTKSFSYTPFDTVACMGLYEFATRYPVYVYMDNVNIVSPFVRVDINEDVLSEVPSRMSWASIVNYNIHLLDLLRMFSVDAHAFIDVSRDDSAPTYMSRVEIVKIVHSDEFVLVKNRGKYNYHFSSILCHRYSGSKSPFDIVHYKYANEEDSVLPMSNLSPGFYHDKDSHETFFIDMNGYTAILRPRDVNTADVFFLAQYAKQLLADNGCEVNDTDICIIPDLRGIVVRGVYVNSVDRLSKCVESIQERETTVAS